MEKRRGLLLIRIVAIVVAVIAALSSMGVSVSMDFNDPQPENPFAAKQAYAAGYTGWDYIGGYWYYYENGVMLTNSWVMDSTDWAYVGSDGRAYQNTWAYLPDSSGTFWYYFGSAAHIVRNCWAPDSTSWGYLDGNGHAVTGWQYIGYYRYYFHPSSASMLTGWLSDGSDWYYFRTAYDTPAVGPDGAMLESGLWLIDMQYYWFKADGRWDPNYVIGEFAERTNPQQQAYYANDCTYYSTGSAIQNCLAFALDLGNVKVWPWSGFPSIAAAETYLEYCDYCIYNVSTPLSYPYIVAYQKDGKIVHFARVNATGNTFAKWGPFEIFKHGSYDPYTDNVYGHPAFCAKR